MKKGYLIGALVCVLLGAAFLLFYLHPWLPSEEPVPAPPAPVVDPGGSSSAPAASSSEQQPEPDGTEPPEEFAKQRKSNGDIYAWIRIPDTTVDYPVLQHPSDDTYYLDHNIHGRKTVGGALFTERVYNPHPFSDPVTIIYGHKLRSGAMFGSLQAIYSDPDGFAANRRIDVWLEDSYLQFEVFAALPYDNRHILYTYDFSDERVFHRFFKDIFATRALGANFDSDAAPTEEDHVLILSTCLKGDNTRRYLVMAKQVT